MIYSSWRPSEGGYQYYQTAQRVGLANDLPTPALRAGSPIGVASVDAGRPLPADAQLIGTGALARGVIIPLDRAGLSGLGELTAQTWWVSATVVSVAVGLGLWLWRRR